MEFKDLTLRQKHKEIYRTIRDLEELVDIVLTSFDNSDQQDGSLTSYVIDFGEVDSIIYGESLDEALHDFDLFKKLYVNKRMIVRYITDLPDEERKVVSIQNIGKNQYPTKTKFIYGKINIPQRELYDHIASSWTKEQRGTIPLDQRFVKDFPIGQVTVYYAKQSARTLLHSLVIRVNDGEYLTFNSEMTPKEFDTVIKNLV